MEPSGRRTGPNTSSSRKFSHNGSNRKSQATSRSTIRPNSGRSVSLFVSIADVGRYETSKCGGGSFLVTQVQQFQPGAPRLKPFVRRRSVVEIIPQPSLPISRRFNICPATAEIQTRYWRDLLRPLRQAPWRGSQRRVLASVDIGSYSVGSHSDTLSNPGARLSDGQKWSRGSVLGISTACGGGTAHETTCWTDAPIPHRR